MSEYPAMLCASKWNHWFVMNTLISFSDSEKVNRCWNSLVLAGRCKFSERMAKHKRHVCRSIIYVCVYTFWITLLRIRPPGKPDESGVDVLTVQYSRIRRADSERQVCRDVINTAAVSHVASRLRAQSDDSAGVFAFTCATGSVSWWSALAN